MLDSTVSSGHGRTDDHIPTDLKSKLIGFGLALHVLFLSASESMLLFQRSLSIDESRSMVLILDSRSHAENTDQGQHSPGIDCHHILPHGCLCRVSGSVHLLRIMLTFQYHGHHSGPLCHTTKYRGMDCDHDIDRELLKPRFAVLSSI